MTNNEIDKLRREYEEALVAHDECLRALTGARLRGADALPALVETEACAHEILMAKRDRLLAAIVSEQTAKAPATPPLVPTVEAPTS